MTPEERALEKFKVIEQVVSARGCTARFVSFDGENLNFTVALPAPIVALELHPTTHPPIQPEIVEIWPTRRYRWAGRSCFAPGHIEVRCWVVTSDGLEGFLWLPNIQPAAS